MSGFDDKREIKLAFVDGKEVNSEEQSPVFKMVEEFTRKVTEEEDAFILETISPYLTQCYKLVIPKKVTYNGTHLIS
jgi:hypothetical protein